MADGTPAAPAAPAAPTEPAPAGEPGKTFTQEELDRIVGERLGRERQKYEGFDDLKAKAEQFDELQRAQQTDLERVTGERDTFKTTAETSQAENLRLRVALAKNLPAELIDRLHGGTKEEMEADADQLLELVAARRDEPAFNGGVRTAAQPEDDMNARLRSLRAGR